MQERIDKALDIAFSCGGIDGAHHKAWVIDQMVRALTGCPMVIGQNPYATTHDGKGFQTIDVEIQGESDEYREFVRAACAGEDGPDTYEWQTGIAP